MDRNFERVFAAMVRSVRGELRLTKDFMSYYGYHESKTDLLPMQRRDVYRYSIWQRFEMDRFRKEHFEVALYLFAAKAIFNVNLIPYLNEALNALLSDTYEELRIEGMVSKGTVEHLDAYLLWKSEGGEKLKLDDAFDRLLVILEAGLIREMVLRSIGKPDGEDFLFEWLLCREGDKYAIKPTFQSEGIHSFRHGEPDGQRQLA